MTLSDPESAVIEDGWMDGRMHNGFYLGRISGGLNVFQGITKTAKKIVLCCCCCCFSVLILRV